MQINDASGLQGIVQDIDFLVDTDSSSYPLSHKIRNINLAYDEVVSLILQSDGTWQWDDYNYGDLPIAVTDLVANQKDYTLLVDFLTITRIEIMNQDGIWYTPRPFDQSDTTVALDEWNKTAGQPRFYDKIANTIVLYPKPNYASTQGLKVYTTRNAKQFTTSDTTVEPAFARPFHRVLSLTAALDYARNYKQDRVASLVAARDSLIKSMLKFYNRREEDVPQTIRAVPIASE
jgi:hypothetical protein